MGGRARASSPSFLPSFSLLRAAITALSLDLVSFGEAAKEEAAAAAAAAAYLHPASVRVVNCQGL